MTDSRVRRTSGLLRATWLPSVGYLCLAILLTLPYPLHLWSGVLSDAPDTDLTLWALSWNAHALVTDPLHIFDANIFAPARHTLAYSENFLGVMPVAAPVIWLTGNPVLAMNIVALLSAVLCGTGTYVLVRRLLPCEAGPDPRGRLTSHLSAFVAGAVYAFTPTRFLRLDQLHLATLCWIPFTLAYLHAYLDEGKPGDLQAAMGFFVLQAVTSGHGAVFTILAVAALLAWRVASGMPLALRRRFADVGLTGAALIAAGVLLALPYLAAQREAGLRRTLDNWSVPAISFLASPTHADRFLLSAVSAGWIEDAASAYLFPGVIPLALAVLAFVPPLRRDARWFYLALLLATIWLAVGPPFGIWPLVYWLPGMNFIRVPSRFTLLGVLALAVLAGFGVERLVRGASPRKQTAIAVACAVLLVIECAAIPFDVTPHPLRIPAADRWLALQPGRFTIAELPLPLPSQAGAFERRQATYMLHTRAHWQKTVNGYSGFLPPAHASLYEALSRFPARASLDALSAFHVTYVVVHTDYYEAGEWERVERGIDAERLELVHADHDGRVYRLRD